MCQKRVIHVFSDALLLVGDFFHLKYLLKMTHPLIQCPLRHIYTQTASAVTAGEKNSIIRKCIMDIHTGLRRSVPVTLKPKKWFIDATLPFPK